jgi:hypothetical protein
MRIRIQLITLMRIQMRIRILILFDADAGSQNDADPDTDPQHCLEYQSVCPFVGIGSSRTISRKLVCSPPRKQRWGGGSIRLRVRAPGEPIRTTGDKTWHSYTLCCRPFPRLQGYLKILLPYLKTPEKKKTINKHLFNPH